MSNLLYNPSDDVLVDRVALAAVATPSPRGAFHQPISFGDYMELVEHSFNQHGYAFRDEEYAVTNDGQRFFGAAQVISLSDGVDLLRSGEQKMLVAFRGSHDQRIPRGLAVGTQTMVCSNLWFSGNLGTFSTRQTTNIWERLPALVSDAVSRIPSSAALLDKRYDAYKMFKLSPRHGDAALVELSRRKALSPAQLGKAIQEWDKPSHDEFTEDGFTANRLMQAVTESLKPGGNNVNFETIAQRSEIATTFIDSFAMAA